MEFSSLPTAHLFLRPALALLLITTACASDVPLLGAPAPSTLDSSTSVGSATGSTQSEATDAPPSEPTTDNETSAEAETTTEADIESGTPNDSSSTGSETDPDDAPPLYPNGSSCDFNEQCESQKCWFHEGVSVWGHCGDCLTDAECAETSLGLNCTGMFDGQPPHCSDGGVGEACQSDSACAAGHCTIAHYGYGQCDACDSDQGCQEAGVGLNCTYSRDLGVSVCSDGALGESCDAHKGCADKACTDGHCSMCRDAQQCRDSGEGANCARVFEPVEWLFFHQCLPGELGEKCEEPEACLDGWCASTPTGRRCSGCQTTDDCDTTADEVCHLRHTYPSSLEVPDYRSCVAARSIPNDAYCDLANAGGDACAGHCVWAKLVASEKELGLCGECRPEEPDDCPDGGTCLPLILSPEQGTACE
ncbi:MAG: fimbrillin family protein [Nannocystaceae bacterium]